MGRIKITAKNPESDFYQAFEQLDGTHPWQEAAPEGFVPYRVRRVFGGEVTYFNFTLAKEMGLIPSNHPNAMNRVLEEKVLSTFAIQIINEYDELSKRRIDPTTIKPNPYMATRYLQLQHKNKQGKTSGDGRGIWNGTVNFKGKTWDVSSRGTGVTRLAPGAVNANKPLRTGSEDFGYGCGLAEIDELYGAAIMAEIMHLQGFNTERVLCIVDLGRGTGIGVRAAPNLLRPAHLFPFLKQGRYNELKKATDYWIDRQVKNKEWPLSVRGSQKYIDLVNYVADAFARFAAQLEVEYVFAWLDWDGDNVLANGGIIDYGSIRQFGLRHDQYRYDDVERWSTNLNEQKTKARQIVQVFCQLSDYLITSERKQLKAFANHPALIKFDKNFEKHYHERFLYKLGFAAPEREHLVANHMPLFREFLKSYSYFEMAKLKGPALKVADGINKPALFNMRKVLRELPKALLQKFEAKPFTETEFFDLIRSQLATQKKIQLGEKHKFQIHRFLRLYQKLILAAFSSDKMKTRLKALSERANLLNSESRITGNALIQIVEEIVQSTKSNSIKPNEIQHVIDKLILKYEGLPEIKAAPVNPINPLKANPDLYSRILSLVEEYAEDI